MGDCLIYGGCGLVLVAGMDLRLDWLRGRRALHRAQRPSGCKISYNLPRRGSGKLWHLGQLVVCV